jgi:hypothetical protein
MTRKDPAARPDPANPSTQPHPDPADSYGREKPEKQAGQGRLDNETATPAAAPDRGDHAVRNRQQPKDDQDISTEK